jgi:hypothetical protein
MTDRAQSSARHPRAGSSAIPKDRSKLMEQHAAARARREAATLGSEEFRTAAEEVARIEVAIARLEEPPPERGAEGLT